MYKRGVLKFASCYALWSANHALVGQMKCLPTPSPLQQAIQTKNACCNFCGSLLS